MKNHMIKVAVVCCAWGEKVVVRLHGRVDDGLQQLVFFAPAAFMIHPY